MYAVGYIRVSTDKQAKRGISLHAQEARFNEWCTRNDKVPRLCVDSGRTAKRAALRPAFAQAVSLACELKCPMVVWKLDRFARSALDALQVAEQLRKSGASLISIQEGWTFDDSPMGKLALAMFASISEWERDMIAERCKDISAFRKERGLRYGPNLPYGTRLDADGTTLRPEPSEQIGLGIIRSLQRKGRTAGRIVYDLEELGIPTRTGKTRWSRKVVQGILERMKP